MWYPRLNYRLDLIRGLADDRIRKIRLYQRHVVFPHYDTFWHCCARDYFHALLHMPFHAHILPYALDDVGGVHLGADVQPASRGCSVPYHLPQDPPEFYVEHSSLYICREALCP